MERGVASCKRSQRQRERGGRQMGSSPHAEWPGGIAAATLFFEDLEAARGFYAEVFALPVVYEDDNSTVFPVWRYARQSAESERSDRPRRPCTRRTADGGCPLPVHARRRGRGRDVRPSQAARRRAAERPDRSTLGRPHGQLSRSRRTHLGDSSLNRARGRRTRANLPLTVVKEVAQAEARPAGARPLGLTAAGWDSES